jgi:hypothetical protein
MKKTDLEKLYRANQHKFSDRPSKDAWNRLERRLDDHYGRRHNPRMNRQYPIAMVAALLILTVMIGSITIFLNNQQGSGINSQSASIEFEEIKNVEIKSVQEVIEFTKRHQERLAKPIEEGEDGKKIQIAK